MASDMKGSRGNGVVGVVERPTYRLEVWKTNAPNKARFDGDYIYITKRHNDGSIVERSIGLPCSDLVDVVRLLQRI